jgi:hypothetical protein
VAAGGREGDAASVKMGFSSRPRARGARGRARRIPLPMREVGKRGGGWGPGREGGGGQGSNFENQFDSPVI